MEPQNELRCCGRGVFVPLLIILLGVLFLLDQMHWFSAHRAFEYFWPAVFIIFGLECLSWRPRGPRLFWGVIGVGIGCALIAENLGYLRFDIRSLWPLLLIAFGLAMLFRGPGYRRRLRYRRHGEAGPASGGSGDWRGGGDPPAPAAAVATPASDDDAYVYGAAVLGGFQRRVTIPNFRGGHVTACLGGYNLDLSRCEIAGDSAVIDIFACFGGGEIRVPEHWVIEVQVQQLLGGCSDETRQSPPPVGAKRLIIQGTTIFGGVVIKN